MLLIPSWKSKGLNIKYYVTNQTPVLPFGDVGNSPSPEWARPEKLKTICQRLLQSGQRMTPCNFEEFPVYFTNLCYASSCSVKQEKKKNMEPVSLLPIKVGGLYLRKLVWNMSQ